MKKLVQIQFSHSFHQTGRKSKSTDFPYRINYLIMVLDPLHFFFKQYRFLT